MANYIKVCPFIAEQLGLTGIRQETADGNYILWEQDIVAIEGETLEEKSKHVGGAVLSSKKGKEEVKGTDSPIPLMEISEEELPEEETENPGEEPDTEQKTEDNSGETASNNNETETTKKRRKSK